MQGRKVKKTGCFYFRVAAANNCPLYRQGEVFSLSDRALKCPKNKAACLILVREMTSLLFDLLDADPESEKNQETTYSCSGCLGLIKFHLVSEEKACRGEPISSIPYLAFTDKEQLAAIREHPLVQAIPEADLFSAVSCFRKERLPGGTTLISKGDSSPQFYLILSGEVEVSDGSLHIATLGGGDICGEMSFFGGGEAGADVRATQETLALCISTEAFSKLLRDIPELQFFMAQTLAKRLRLANAGNLGALGAGMCGWLNEIPPSELLQVLHMNRKTGVLDLEFPKERATVFFREGDLVGVRYGEKTDREALIALLQEKEGRYSYTAGLPPEKLEAPEIGDFMILLMEGVTYIDESKAGG